MSLGGSVEEKQDGWWMKVLANAGDCKIPQVAVSFRTSEFVLEINSLVFLKSLIPLSCEVYILLCAYGPRNKPGLRGGPVVERRRSGVQLVL